MIRYPVVVFNLYQTGLAQEHALSAVDTRIPLFLSSNNNRNPLVLFIHFNWVHSSLTSNSSPC